MAIAIRSNSQISYPILSAGAFTATLAVRETAPAGAPKPRLLDKVREAFRAKHYSRRKILSVGQTGACDTTVASHGDRQRLR